MQNTQHNSRADKDNTPFNAEEFSSRKLMDLVDQNQHRERLDIDTEMLMAVVTELTQRRHYLRELRDRGLLAPRAY
jgi:CBS-domain-containing membrane protein